MFYIICLDTVAWYTYRLAQPDSQKSLTEQAANKVDSMVGGAMPNVSLSFSYALFAVTDLTFFLQSMKSNSQMAGDNMTGKDVSTGRFLLHYTTNFFSFCEIRSRCSTRPRMLSEWVATATAAATTTTELIVVASM